jgi:hypothetical protein
MLGIIEAFAEPGIRDSKGEIIDELRSLEKYIHTYK